MAQLAVWILLCLGAAVALRRRPVHAVCLVLVLWFLVPAVAGHHVTGLVAGAISFHPATWLVIVVFAVQLVTHPAALSGVLSRHIYAAVAMGVFVAVCLVTSYASSSGGSTLLVDQIVSPLLMFGLVVAFASAHYRRLLLLRNTVLGLVAFQCVLAVIQWRLGRVVFYADDFERLYWFNPDTIDRWMGTTDHPLVLSLAVCIAAPMTQGLTSSSTRFALLTVFTLGAVVTQSRIAVSVMGLLLLYILVRARMSALSRLCYAALLAAGGFAVVTSQLVTGVSERFADDSGSSEARGLAFKFFFESWTDFAVAGRGLTSSYRIARETGLETSLESSLLMYAVDTGLLFAMLYFGTQFLLAVQHGRQRVLAGATLGAIAGCTVQQFFSAVAATNLSGTLVWTAVGLVVAAASSRPDHWDQQRPADRKEARVGAV